MLRIPLRAWTLALLSACLQVVVFPRASLYFLCWMAMVPLLYALLRGHGGEAELINSEGRSLRPFTLAQGFVLGWATGIVWYIGSCYWIVSVMHTYGNVDTFLAVLIMLAFCLIMGLHHGAFGLLVVWMARRSTTGNRRPLLLAPVFWVAIEFFRDRVTPVPWNPLGNAQIDNIPFARVAQFTGVYGLSFAILLVNCAFTAALLLRGRRRLNLLISATAAAIALQMGVLAHPAPFATTKDAVLLQPNIPIDSYQWTAQSYDQNLFEMTQMSVHATAKNPPGSPGQIVWPESPAPFLDSDAKVRHWLAAMAQDANSYLIIGLNGTADNRSRGGQFQYFNSALVVDPRGDEIGRYDKIHLVPFGEYVPMSDLLSFARKLTREVGAYSRGTDRKVFDVNGARAGIAICYESSFPDEVREFAANGAQVLVNISNDAWFGDSAAPFHHLDTTRMRAIENHRWVLISTNNGITASVDPFGRIVRKAERNTRTALVAPFAPETETTFYTRNGDIFAWICVVISCLALFVRARFSSGAMIEPRPA
ncbi:MAG TPA: apolipoprotein N-acyltransferase [Verrucomicrobiae bacterium]|nr:apolipoprotein N-acyltransferase [Verrucomicrobiae bacterium]